MDASRNKEFFDLGDAFAIPWLAMMDLHSQLVIVKAKHPIYYAKLL